MKGDRQRGSALEFFRGLGPFPSSMVACVTTSKAAEAAADRMQRVEQAFAAFEGLAASGSPGLLDLLKVYGVYETAMEQSEAYMAAFSPKAEPRFVTSNTSAV